MRFAGTSSRMSRAKRMKTEEIRGLLGLARRARSLTVGSRETRAGLRRGRVSVMLVAGDGSPRDRDRLLRAAEESDVPAFVLGTRAELGEAVGRATVAVLGVTDRNLAAGVLDRLGKAGDGSARGRRTNGGQKR